MTSRRRRAGPRDLSAPERRLRDAMEDLVQPLTAVLARVETLQAEVRDGTVEDLTSQLAALRTSAERLAVRIDAVRRSIGS